MKTSLANQRFPYSLVIIALWVMSIPVIASNRFDQTHLQMPLSTDDARHLLMRTGFGARAEDVAKLRGQTRQIAIDRIVDGLSIEPEVPMPGWVNSPLPLYHAQPDREPEERQAFNKQRDAELNQLRQWWVLNILQTSSPQTERLVLFWHDLFATDYRSIGKHSLAMARQNQTFRKLGVGSWQLLIKAMIRDAALLKFLDAGSNHKASPNENLARELMELFVLGEGNYDEMTVQEAARSLTGHDTSLSHDLQFRLKTGAQDRGDKQLFGETGAFDGDDLVERLLLQKAAPRFLASRFWYAFISDNAPDSVWVDYQASRFTDSALDIATLYRNVLQSEAFWDEDNRGSMIKSPLDIVAGTARTLNYPMSQWQSMPQWQRLIGMDLFAPPDVAGWKEGAAFVTPGRLLNRYKVVRQMLRRAAKKSNENQFSEIKASEIKASEIKSSEIKSSEMDMASSSAQEAVVTSDDAGAMFLDDYANTMLQVDNNMQARSSSLAMNVDSRMQADSQSLESLSTDTSGNTLKAASVHLRWANGNKENGVHRLEIVLDHLQMPDKDYQQVSFVIVKRKNGAMELQLNSFSCWPDCVDPWPECSLVDKHFTDVKRIILPWMSTDSGQWSQSHDYQCQFESLDENEKTLVSTLWAELPNLLTTVKLTPRVQKHSERWLSIIESLEEQYRQNLASVKLSDTAYAPFAQSMDISSDYAKPEPALQPLSEPLIDVSDIKSLMAALHAEDLLLHELLLPRLSGEQVPALPVADTTRPDRYLKSVVEHPLFQLK